MSSVLSQIVEERSAPRTALEAFVYGEQLDDLGQRSLGFGLLVPQTPSTWSAEAESLARKLQAAPYPDDWPAADLFCSVLLEGGERLVALARYGVSDSTPSKRRGGLEMIGVVGPHSLSLTSVRTIEQWLAQQRNRLDRIGSFSGSFDLVEVLADTPAPPEQDSDGLPAPLGPERSIVLPANSALEPNSRLGMVAFLRDHCWQWLPYIDHDFNLTAYSQRGPIVAWTTPLARNVRPALPVAELAQPAVSPRGGRGWIALLAFLLFGLLGANAWYLWRLDQRLDELKPNPAIVPSRQPSSAEMRSLPPVEATPEDDEAVVKALYHHLRTRGNIPENRREQLLQNYERLVAGDPMLRVGSMEGRLALGAIVEMSKRKTPAQIEAIIRGIGADKKGIDEGVIELIAERVYQRLTEK